MTDDRKPLEPAETNFAEDVTPSDTYRDFESVHEDGRIHVEPRKIKPSEIDEMDEEGNILDKSPHVHHDDEDELDEYEDSAEDDDDDALEPEEEDVIEPEDEDEEPGDLDEDQEDITLESEDELTLENEAGQNPVEFNEEDLKYQELLRDEYALKSYINAEPQEQEVQEAAAILMKDESFKQDFNLARDDVYTHNLLMQSNKQYADSYRFGSEAEHEELRAFRQGVQEAARARINEKLEEVTKSSRAARLEEQKRSLVYKHQENLLADLEKKEPKIKEIRQGLNSSIKGMYDDLKSLHKDFADKIDIETFKRNFHYNIAEQAASLGVDPLELMFTMTKHFTKPAASAKSVKKIAEKQPEVEKVKKTQIDDPVAKRLRVVGVNKAKATTRAKTLTGRASNRSSTTRNSAVSAFAQDVTYR